jgi:hypothetical protein
MPICSSSEWRIAFTEPAVPTGMNRVYARLRAEGRESPFGPWFPMTRVSSEKAW